MLKEKPDVVVVVIDASQLERTSYLLAEIIDLQIPYVVALNMIDVAQNMGIEVNAKKMQEEIGASVVPLVAAKGKGISELLEAIDEASQKGKLEHRTVNIYKDEIDSGIQRISEIVKEEKFDKYPADWIAVKLLEDDDEVISYCKDGMLATNWFEIKSIRGKLGDGRMVVAGQRYNWISEIIKKAVKRPSVEELSAKRGKFDKIATHPILGYLLAMMIIVTGLIVTFVIGMPVAFMIMGFVPTLSAAASNLLSGMPSWISGSIALGLIPGVGIGLAMDVW
ncbi:MAG: FeoB small GTPase domain-containing protein [Alkaliphilus sp.]